MHSFTVIFFAALVGSTTALKAKFEPDNIGPVSAGSITREIVDLDTGKPVQEGHKRQIYEEEMEDEDEENGATGLPTMGEYHYEDGAGPPEVGLIPTRAQMEMAQRLQESKADFIEVPEMDPKLEDENGEKSTLDTIASAAQQVTELATGGKGGVAFKQVAQDFGNAYVDQVKANVKINEEMAEDMAFHVLPNMAKKAKTSVVPAVGNMAEQSLKQGLNDAVNMAGQAVNLAAAFR